LAIERRASTFSGVAVRTLPLLTDYRMQRKFQRPTISQQLPLMLSRSPDMQCVAAENMWVLRLVGKRSYWSNYAPSVCRKQTPCRHSNRTHAIFLPVGDLLPPDHFSSLP
jgi:hypothetical protein